MKELACTNKHLVTDVAYQVLNIIKDNLTFDWNRKTSRNFHSLCNIILNCKYSEIKEFRISLAKNNYAPGSFYHARGYSLTVYKGLLYAMEKAGLVVITIGKWHSTCPELSKQSVILPSSLLMDILKDIKITKIYEDIQPCIVKERKTGAVLKDIAKEEEVINRINNHLAKYAWRVGKREGSSYYTLVGKNGLNKPSCKDLSNCNITKYLLDSSGLKIDLDKGTELPAPRLQRQYIYDSKFGKNSYDNYCGGRFYFDTQRIPHLCIGKDRTNSRLLISADSNPMDEIDFKCLHISMLYNKFLSMHAPNDSYCVFGDYRDKKLRDVVKSALLIMINAKDRKTAVKSMSDPRKQAKKFELESGELVNIKNKLLEFGLTIDELFGLIEKAHPLLTKFFFCDMGIKLQRIESDIIMQVMIRLMKLDVAFFPVHDSILVDSRYTDKATQIMHEEYFVLMGFIPVTETETHVEVCKEITQKLNKVIEQEQKLNNSVKMIRYAATMNYLMGLDRYDALPRRGVYDESYR